jgi:hypothetical protein
LRSPSASSEKGTLKMTPAFWMMACTSGGVRADGLA